MDYRKRCIDTQILELFSELPALLIEGPKAVGKTTTAMQHASTIRRLDDPAQALRARAEIDWLFEAPKPILIDEWQRVPESWDAVKRAVDADRSASQYIFTGSLPDSSTHSGAGRITSLRMRPLSFAERGLETPQISLAQLLNDEATHLNAETIIGLNDYCNQIASSGFPGYQGLAGRALKAELDSYIQRIIDTDLAERGVKVRKPATMRAWLQAYAAATATTATWESIRDSANYGSGNTPAKTTVLPFRDALTRLAILDELPAWTPSKNQFKRVGLASKHYLADPALAARLLGHDATTLQLANSPKDSSTDAPLVGRLFEALVALSVRVYADANFANTFHYRDGLGRHEVDLIVQREDGKFLAIEVKLGNKVESKDYRHLNWLAQELPDQIIDRVVIYTGKYAYRENGVAIIPLALLGA